MNIIEALKTEKPFRRKNVHEAWMVDNKSNVLPDDKILLKLIDGKIRGNYRSPFVWDDGFSVAFITKESLMADDWEVLDDSEISKRLEELQASSERPRSE